MRRREFPASIAPQRAPTGILRGKRWRCHLFPLKIPLGLAVKNLIARSFFSAHISGSFFFKTFVTVFIRKNGKFL